MQNGPVLFEVEHSASFTISYLLSDAILGLLIPLVNPVVIRVVLKSPISTSTGHDVKVIHVISINRAVFTLINMNFAAQNCVFLRHSTASPKLCCFV